MTEITQTVELAVKTTDQRAGKYLTFRLANEDYGIEILKVQEIMGMIAVTRVPRTPEFMRGVINLRGKVIPVVDLRLKFALEGKEDTEWTCIIVVQVGGGSDLVTMGFIVDEVSEVLDIPGQDIEDAPSFGVRLDTAYILGMAKTKDGLMILVDIDKVLATCAITQLKKTA